MAKTYYDSTISILPKDEKEYDLTKTRQEILEEFVKYIVTIKKNDSLINLTYLSADSIDALITARLDTEEEAAKERKKKLAKAKRNNQSVGNVSFYNESNQVTLSASISGDWYFYNTAAVSRGLSDFRQKWGQRDLVDNWRRSDIAIRQLSENTSLEPSKPEGQSENTEEQSLSREDMKNEMVAKIPSSPDQIALLKKEIETAYFELGKIYNFKLEEKQNAIEKFNQLLLRFPESQYKPEVLYQLYLLNAGVDSVASDQAATILIKDFPETIYAKLVINPNYIEENEKLRLELQRIYSRAYNYYRDHQFDDSLVLLDSALQSNPQNEFADYLLLLRAMCLGEIDGVYKYQYELNNFIKTHPESELATYAQKLVLISEQYQINLFSASKAKYIRNFEERHYYLILYKSEDKLTQLIPDLISEYIGEGTNNLSTGNLIFDEDYAMVLINEFAGKREAKIFYGEISDSLEIPEEINSSELISLVITKENFEIFYETKDLDSYLTFFDKHYLR
jgi:outer membrane protein assembly factor BamD (BamD/ComL family)